MHIKIVDQTSAPGAPGITIHYNVLDNGTCYHADTPLEVVEALENARRTGTRIRVFYGDQETGRCWMDEWDTTGTVGRSTGRIKIPLLIKTRRSYSGGALLDHCIVKITSGHAPAYFHPKFHTPRMTIRPIVSTDYVGKTNLWAEGYTHAVDFDGEPQANFKSEDKARRYVAFMNGTSNRH